MTSLLPFDPVAPLARAVTEINVLSRAVVFCAIWARNLRLRRVAGEKKQTGVGRGMKYGF